MKQYVLSNYGLFVLSQHKRDRVDKEAEKLEEREEDVKGVSFRDRQKRSGKTHAFVLG